MGRTPGLMVALLLSLPAQASAAGAPYTLREVSAMAPGQRSFTGSPLLELTGLPAGFGPLDLPEPGARDGEYQVLDLGDLSLVAGPFTNLSLDGVDLILARDAFLATHGDEYDFLALFSVGEVGTIAFYSPLQNDTRGLGLPLVDQSTPAGFPSLDGWLFLNSVLAYETPSLAGLLFAQELAHRWGAYVRRLGGGEDLLGRDAAHWSFYLATGNSPLEGNAWLETAPGRFRTDHLAPVRSSPVDAYLMGLIPAEQVPDWFLIEAPQVLSNPARWGLLDGQPETTLLPPDTPPMALARATLGEAAAAELDPIEVQGTRVDVSLQSVIAVEGARAPSWPDAPSRFSMAFVLVMPESAPISFGEYQRAEAVRESLAAAWEELVGGRATLSTELGTSGSYAFSPESLPSRPVYEPGEACAFSGDGGGLLALWITPLAALLRRRSRARGARPSP